MERLGPMTMALWVELVLPGEDLVLQVILAPILSPEKVLDRRTEVVGGGIHGMALHLTREQLQTKGGSSDEIHNLNRKSEMIRTTRGTSGLGPNWFVRVQAEFTSPGLGEVQGD